MSSWLIAKFMYVFNPKQFLALMRRYISKCYTFVKNRVVPISEYLIFIYGGNKNINVRNRCISIIM